MTNNWEREADPSPAGCAAVGIAVYGTSDLAFGFEP